MAYQVAACSVCAVQSVESTFLHNSFHCLSSVSHCTNMDIQSINSAIPSWVYSPPLRQHVTAVSMRADSWISVQMHQVY